MKKSLSLLVAIAMVFSMFATSVFAADEKTTEQKYDELVKAGIFAGLPGGEAGLDQTMTRAQAAVIIAKLAGYKDGVTSPDAGFTDVPATHWAKAYVDYAANLGIISGLSNGTFAPSANVTIQELAKLAVDALAKLGYTLKDAAAVDGTVAEWAKEYVGKAISNGIFAAQADYTIPALRGLLVTATYSAYAALQVPAAITVESVKATNSKTLVATFNVEVGTATANDFTVTTKDDEYAINVVDSVAIDGKTVKINLVDSLDEETTYVLTSNGVVSKENNLVLASTKNEVSYVATEAVSIGFGSTTVKDGNKVPVVIKDAAGNDITANFDLSEAITIESSDTGVVSDADLTAANPVVNSSAYSVVNVKLNDTKFETGNTIITVKNTLSVASKIGVVTVADDFGTEDLNLFKSTPDVLIAQVLDQDGTDITDELAVGDVTYRSQNPTVAVIDETSGDINGVKAGTATILVKAVYNGKTVSKTVTVTVKADAELTSIVVELPSSKLVKLSGITQDLKVKLLDQYGNAFKVTDAAGKDVVFTITKNDIVEVDGDEFVTGAANAITLNIAQNQSETKLVLEPGQVKGSGSIKVVVGSLSKSVSVALVEAGTFAGYVAVAGDTTLDVEQKDPVNPEHPVTTGITVYKKDVNGNYIETVTSGVDLDVADDAAVTVNDATLE
ncbi:S-layer homology domain-containing protein, partial [Paenibacillus sp. MCAF20]